MRTITIIFLALLLPIAQAQDPANTSDQIELNAWSAYCSSQLDGNPALCACILDKQFQQNDPSVVKGSLLQMVKDDPDASDSDNTTAQNKLTVMYSGDRVGALEDMEDFKETLDGNVNACTPKGN